MIINTLVGGASNKKYAQIKITCPAGVTLSMSNGKKSVEATTTQSPTLVYVPDAGTWVISGVWEKYNLTSSTSAAVTEPSTIIEATLTFKLYLCKPGDQCVAVTGGWKQLGQFGSLSFTSAGMKITQVGDVMSYFGCNSFAPSTLADFRTLKATLASVERSQANTPCSLQIAPNNTVPSGSFPSVSTTAGVTIGTNGSYNLGTKSILIDNINSGYPRVQNYYWSFTLSYIWLET